MEAQERAALEDKARTIRKMTIDEIGYLGVGHIGGAMSVIDILTVLYYKVMKIDAENPSWEKRDKLVVSKGHAGPAVYAVLADKGYFPQSWLHTLNIGGTNLPSHCDMNRTPGIDFTTGSLGQGTSAAMGIALGDRMKGIDAYTYLIIGDGESQEGQVWEAAMFAAHYRLGKMIAFTDFNKMQIDGEVAAVMGIEDIMGKWSGFGWHVQRIDGHDVGQISDAIAAAQQEQERPSMIICDTIKGKGFFPGEGKVGSHSMAFDYARAQEAIAQLEQEGSR